MSKYLVTVKAKVWTEYTIEADSAEAACAAADAQWEQGHDGYEVDVEWLDSRAFEVAE